MENLQVILILVVFLSGVALMMSKKLPAILSLPCMGILIAAIAGFHLCQQILKYSLLHNL